MKLTAKVLVPILAVSLCQVARAIAFTSLPPGGDWSNPASWDDGILVPDTYSAAKADTATIAFGHVINYNDVGGGNGSMSTPVGLVPVVTGGFAIAGGSSVLIDGGTLTQTTLTQEMRVGEGKAGGAGTGLLTIATGGTLDTGAAIGLGIGTKISGAATGGNGELDLNEGLLKLGAGASVGGLGVGIDASMGLLKVGDGGGAAGSAVVDLATNNVLLAVGANNGLGGGTGVVIVDLDGRINFGTGSVNVGQGGGTGNIAVFAGGVITGTSGAFLIGQGAGSTGTLTNAGTIGTAVTSTGEVRIGGGGGHGTLTMTGGTLRTTGELNMGTGAGSVGTGTLSGGTLSFGTVHIGRDGGTSTVGISGAATLGSTDWFNVGEGGGIGHVNQTGGTVTFGQWLAIGLSAGAAGSNWDISGGNITSGGGIEVGSDRDGTMTISGSANINVGNFTVGVRPTGSGHVTMSGGTLNAGSVLNVGGRDGGADTGTGEFIHNGGAINVSGDLNIGKLGSGTFTQNGGTVNVNGNHIQVADGGGTNGTLNITAGTISNSSWIHVGSGGGSTGNLNVNFTNPANSITTGALYLGNNSATGFTTVSSGSLLAAGVVEIGRGSGTGTLTVTGANSSVEGFTGGAFDQFFRVGTAAGHGIVNVSAGGKVRTNGGWFTVGENDGSVGEATFSGAGTTLTSRGLIVGWNGLSTGTLNILNNAVVNNSGHETSIGRDYGGANSPTGTINIASGGILNAGDELRIGGNANGIVNINGGTLNTTGGGWTILGEGGAANGTVNMTNGVFNDNSAKLSIAQNPGSVGTFSQSGASTTTIAGELNIARDRGVGELNVNGGTFSVAGWTVIGRDNNGNVGGMGTINVRNGATFQHLASGGGDMLLGWKGGSVGKINVTTGGKMIYNWWFRAAVDPGSQGDVLVDGANSRIDLNTGRVYIGERGSGSLTVTNGGVFSQTNGDQFNVGGNDGSSTGDGAGTMNIAGAGSTVSTNNFIRAGFGNTGADPAVGVVNLATGGTMSSSGWIGFGHEGGDGTLNMTGGTLTTGSELYVGIDDNGHTRQTTGTVTVSGNSAVTVGSRLFVGRAGGSGVFNLNSGTVNVNDWVRVADGGVGSGGGVTTGVLNVNGPNSHLNAFTGGGGDFFRTGNGGGNGTVNITAGGSINTNAGWFTLGENNNTVSHVTVDGTGSTLHSNGLIVGWNGSGQGTLTISNNGVVTNVGHELSVGRDNTNTQGTININSGGVLNTIEPRIGHNGIGIINMNGGTFNATGGWTILGSDGGNSNGTVTMTGASAFNVSGGRVMIGRFGTGLLSLSGTSTFTHTGADQFIVGGVEEENGFNSNFASHGTLSVGGSAAVSTTNFIRVGQGNAGVNPAVGTINLSGGSINGGGWIGFGHEGGDGHLNMSGGSITVTNEFYVGIDNNGHTRQTTGVAVMTGGTINSGSLMIGRNGGDGRFTNSGGTINTGGINVGHGSAGSVGRFTQFSGTTTGSGALDVGNGNGQGTVILNGGTVSSNGFYVGTNPGGNGLVNVNNGTLNIEGWTEIGRYGGTGTVNVDGPTAILDGTSNDMMIGYHTGSTGVVNILNGGQMNQNWWIVLGRDGGPTATGVINVDGSGSKLTHTSGRFILGGDPNDGAQSGTGIVNISHGGWIEETGGNNREIDLGRGVGSTGTMNISTGGKFTDTTDATVYMGVNGSAGYLNITGAGSLFSHTPNIGDFQAAPIIVGWDSTSTAEAHVESGGTLTSSQEIRVAANGGANGLFGVNGGTVTAGVFSLGRNGGNGTMNMQAGSVTTNAWMTVGHDGGHGVLNLTGGNITTNTDHFYVAIGGGSTTGIVNQTGGSVVSHRDVRIGQESTASGTYNLSGAGSTVTADNEFFLGLNGGTGILNQSNGTITAANLRIGTTPNSMGTVTKSGGTMTATGDLTIGWQGNASGNFTNTGGAINVGVDAYVGVQDTATGTFLMSAGTMTIGNRLVIARDAGATGSVQFNGGTIQANFFTYAGGTATVNFNGGTVRAKQNQGDFFNNFTPGMSEVQAGGLIFDSNGFTATANNSLDGVGALTKKGNGTLALTAANTYAGGTVINVGTLNINANAALGNVAGGVAINANSTLQAAAPVTTNRTITLGAGGGRIDTNGNTVTLDTGSTVNGGATIALTHIGAGNLDIKGAQNYAILNANGGLTTLDSALGSGTSTLNANATTQINVSQTLSALNIADGVEVTFGTGLPFAPAPPKPLASFGGLVTAPSIPEPAALSLVMVGALGFIARRRRGPQVR